MGGYGSGFQGTRKLTVEDSRCLSVGNFTTKAMVGSLSRGTLIWSYEDCEPHARISYEANLSDPNAAWVRLTYNVNGTPVDYRVRLVRTQPTYGGSRFWFLCSLGRSEGESSRRVTKLYLPPGEKYFGSRQAHGLTYKLCQESGMYDGLFRRLGAKMGMDVASVRRALKRL